MQMILAVDTATSVLNLAFLDHKNKIHSFQIESDETHSRHLIPQIDLLLKESKASVSDISSLACTNGPGSFTGLRIGLSSVKGIALPGNLPIYTLNTLEAMALDIESSENTLISVAINGGRGEVFFCKYIREEGKIREILTPNSIFLPKLKESIAEKDILAGNGFENLQDIGKNLFYPKPNPARGIIKGILSGHNIQKTDAKNLNAFYFKKPDIRK